LQEVPPVGQGFGLPSQAFTRQSVRDWANPPARRLTFRRLKGRPEPDLSATSRPAIVAIDTQTRTVAATIGGASDVQTAQAIQEMTQLAIHPTGSTLYVGDVRVPQSPTNFDTVGFAVFDVATATLTRRVAIPGARNHGLDDLQVSSDGRMITHLDGVRGLATVVDAYRFEVLQQTDLGDAVRTAAAVGP
jgi:hypothetical protein